jgi:hypothetical protein
MICTNSIYANLRQSCPTLSASNEGRGEVSNSIHAIRGHIQRLNPSGVAPTLDDMGKTKIPATGEGYLGEIMVHKLSRAVGVVENVTLSQAGWPPQITLKLPDGTLKRGRLSDFREPSGNERAKFSPV